MKSRDLSGRDGGGFIRPLSGNRGGVVRVDTRFGIHFQIAPGSSSPSTIVFFRAYMNLSAFAGLAGGRLPPACER